MILKNKRGASLMAWAFAIILILLLVVILQTQVLDKMNDIYSTNYSTGINTSGLTAFQTLASSSDTSIEGAEASQTSEGLTITESWTVGKGTYSVLKSFVSGEFISNLLTDILDFPPIVAQMITVMIWLSLIFIIIYIFMKVII